nr:hypothetical protein [Micromonospora sp. DSM 115978]
MTDAQSSRSTDATPTGATSTDTTADTPTPIVDGAWEALNAAAVIEESNVDAVSPHLALAYRAAAEFMAEELAAM